MTTTVITETYPPRTTTTTSTRSSSSSSICIPRINGRGLDQLQSVLFKTKVIRAARGSSYVEIGNTKVICSVYGPNQLNQSQFTDSGSLICDVKYAPFASTVHIKRGQDDVERDLSRIVQESTEICVQLDKFPKSVLEAHVLILETGSCELEAAIQCVSLALADASVELYDMVTSCSAIITSNNKQLLDPTVDEQADESVNGSLTIAYMPSLQQITFIKQIGQIKETELVNLLKSCIDGAAIRHISMRECLSLNSIGNKE